VVQHQGMLVGHAAAAMLLVVSTVGSTRTSLPLTVQQQSVLLVLGQGVCSLLGFCSLLSVRLGLSSRQLKGAGSACRALAVWSSSKGVRDVVVSRVVPLWLPVQHNTPP
jgi:hypothetical protein